jgi:hypothetical protein
VHAQKGKGVAVVVKVQRRQRAFKLLIDTGKPEKGNGETQRQDRGKTGDEKPGQLSTWRNLANKVTMFFNYFLFSLHITVYTADKGGYLDLENPVNT